MVNDQLSIILRIYFHFLKANFILSFFAFLAWFIFIKFCVPVMIDLFSPRVMV